MRCPQCQFDNPPAMKFCGQCGSKLGQPACPSCGAESPPGFKFCGECGTPLASAGAAGAAARPAVPAPPPKPAPVQGYTPPHLAEQVFRSRLAVEGERKQVTVLFCDLVGSTTLADRLGPETMHVLLNRFFELALAEVHRYEGTVNQFLGDGFMALFGAPITHEDHARRAVLAALGLQKQIREHHAELGEAQGIEWTVRMGLNTGWVVVGGIGDHLRMDYTAVGDTTNLAARLQSLAQPGTVLVSETTARLLEGAVELEALEPAYVKGKTELVQAFHVLRAVADSGEQAALGGASLTPFVGRERELSIVEELRDQAARGEGQLVGITGEAGAGKSRLLHELRKRWWDSGAVYLAGRCLSYGSGLPYHPLIHLLRNAWRIAETDPPAAITDKVAAGLGSVGLEDEESLAPLLRLLGGQDGTDRLTDLSAQALRARTFSALRKALLGLGNGRLLIVELEDLQWIDETSEDFLSLFIEDLARAPVLLVATYRSGYRPPWLDRSYATQISMRNLAPQESRTVIEAVLRQDGELPAELVDAILEKAGGNPFFLEELTKNLAEHGDSWSDATVPDTVQGVLMARIDRLPEEHKRLLQTASVLGRELSPDLLGALWDQPAALPPLLADLKRWEFLYEALSEHGSTYLFKHALTQDVVYQSLLTARRQALHAAAARSIEELHRDHLEEAYEDLVYHYPKSGDAAHAIHYLSLFAEKAAGGYAHAEAARALREALALAAGLPEAERDRRTLEILLQLAESLLPLARIPEMLDLFQSHRERAERLDDPALLGRFCFWLALTLSYLGQQQEAIRTAHRAIDAAREAGDEATEGKACYVLSRDGFWSGRFAEGLQHSLDAARLLEQSGGWWWQGQAYWVAGFNCFALGQLEAAFDAMARANTIWETLQDPRLDPSWSTGYFHAALGDWEKGIAECLGGLERARDPLNTAAALGFLGHAYLEKGDLVRAAETLGDSIQRLEQAGMKQLLGWFSAYLAEVRLAEGRLDEARDLASRGLAATLESDFQYGAGLAQRTLGRIARSNGQPDEARQHLNEALTTFEALQVPFEAARTRQELALLAQTQGDRDEALRQLRQAHRIFGELGVPRYVERSETLAADWGISLATSAVRTVRPSPRLP
jgi:class 3 adenylate cyclase/tetratricopeptide (TPR) repeat protein